MAVTARTRRVIVHRLVAAVAVAMTRHLDARQAEALRDALVSCRDALLEAADDRPGV